MIQPWDDFTGPSSAAGTAPPVAEAAVSGLAPVSVLPTPATAAPGRYTLGVDPDRRGAAVLLHPNGSVDGVWHWRLDDRAAGWRWTLCGAVGPSWQGMQPTELLACHAMLARLADRLTIHNSLTVVEEPAPIPRNVAGYGLAYARMALVHVLFGAVPAPNSSWWAWWRPRYATTTKAGAKTPERKAALFTSAAIMLGDMASLGPGVPDALAIALYARANLTMNEEVRP